MNRNNIANFIGFLLLVLTISVACIGYITYNNLDEIVRTLETDSRPNDNLVIYKEIKVAISGMENMVESYSLTKDSSYLERYDESIDKVELLLDSLNSRNYEDINLVSYNDSLMFLINRKTSLLDSLLTIIDQRKKTTRKPLRAYYPSSTRKKSQPPSEQIAEVPDQEDLAPKSTDREEEQKKPGLFKRLFKKKKLDTSTQPQVAETSPPVEEKPTVEELDTPPPPVYIVPSVTGNNDSKATHVELRLETQHMETQRRILELISSIESWQTHKIQENAQNAQKLTTRTNRQLLIFSGLTFALLLATSFIMWSYTAKNRKYQQLLKVSKESTEVLSRAKERFFTNVSHELRTPMNAIAGFTKILLKSDLKPEQREQLQIIGKSSDHLVHLLNDILDFSKLTANKLQLAQKPFHLKELCVDTCKLLRESAESKGLKILERYNNVPEYVIGDPHRLKQILLNILTNAIKYTEEGMVRLNVSAAEKEVDGKLSVNFRIIDTGVGIDKDFQARMFREFEQSDATAFSKGTGLGLAITRRLVYLHKGRMSLESELGEGTRISIRIPFEVTKQVPEPQQKSENFQKLQGLKVLVADDESFNVKLLSTLLTKYQIKHHEAYDGKEALDLLMANAYDIALLDLKMPNMQGWEVVEKIRSTAGPNTVTPCIALSATVTDQIREKCTNAGFNDVMSKPFSEHKLFEKMQKLGSIRDSPEDQKKDNEEEMPQPAPSAPVVDITSLKAMGDDSFVSDMIDTFIENATEGWTTITQAISKGDYEKAGLTAHRIVSPARHFKAEQLVSLLKEIETRSDARDPSLSGDPLISQTDDELNSVIDALKLKLGELK